jgi:hypothetical protein
MLYTNLQHIENSADLVQVTNRAQRVVIVCGNMNPASVAVYRLAELLSRKFSHVLFCDMEFDNPAWQGENGLIPCGMYAEMPIVFVINEGRQVLKSEGELSKPEFKKMLLSIFGSEPK